MLKTHRLLPLWALCALLPLALLAQVGEGTTHIPQARRDSQHVAIQDLMAQLRVASDAESKKELLSEIRSSQNVRIERLRSELAVKKNAASINESQRLEMRAQHLQRLPDAAREDATQRFERQEAQRSTLATLQVAAPEERRALIETLRVQQDTLRVQQKPLRAQQKTPPKPQQNAAENRMKSAFFENLPPEAKSRWQLKEQRREAMQSLQQSLKTASPDEKRQLIANFRVAHAEAEPEHLKPAATKIPSK